MRTWELIVTEGRPFRQRLRTYSQAVQAIIDKEVQKLIDQGVIVPFEVAVRIQRRADT